MMAGPFTRLRLIFLLLILATFLFSPAGCYFFSKGEVQPQAYLPGVKKVVVVGFDAAIAQGGGPEVVRNPLSGYTFMAEPVSPAVVESMTSLLFEKVLEQGRYELVTPGQASGVFSSILASDQNIGLEPLKLLQKVGEAFSADAVMVGYIYRWQKRIGTDYAADRPASVALDLYLVSPRDGAILWKATFDKTQAPLTDNLYDLSTFVESRGRWFTADELGRLGLQKLLAKLPAEKLKKIPEARNERGQSPN
jgi:hypothetical protein